MAASDHIVDLGPGGGNTGTAGAMGTPEEVAQSVQSVTAAFLKERLTLHDIDMNTPLLPRRPLVGHGHPHPVQRPRPCALSGTPPRFLAVQKSEAEWKEELPAHGLFRPRRHRARLHREFWDHHEAASTGAPAAGKPSSTRTTIRIRAPVGRASSNLRRVSRDRGRADDSWGMRRVEVLCSRLGGTSPFR